MDKIYENRKKWGNLLAFIKRKGYTKTSFSTLAGICRSTVNLIIKEGTSS